MYKFMRIIVIFDLPTKEKHERYYYSKFRRFLINDGYVMLQYSVYSRICNNLDGVAKHRGRLSKNVPPKGQVQSLVLTEKQYSSMILHVGKQIKNDNKQPSLFDLI